MKLNEFIAKARKELPLGDFLSQLNRQQQTGIVPVKSCNFNAEGDYEYLLHPLLGYGETTLVYAGKNVGKTLVTMVVAYVVGTGASFLGLWTARKAEKVIYVEGDAPKDSVARKKDSTRQALNFKTRDDDSLVWFLSGAFDLFSDDPEHGRPAIERALEFVNGQDPVRQNVKLVILDSMTTMSSGRHDDTGWYPFIEWVKKLSAKGIHFIILFHAAPDGSLRGSNAKKDSVDNVLLLKDLNRKENDKSDDKSANTPKNPDVLHFLVTPEHLRGNPHSEFMFGVELMFHKKHKEWTFVNQDQYWKHVYSSQSNVMTDQEMADFWQTTKEAIFDVRNSHGIKKYKTKKPKN